MLTNIPLQRARAARQITLRHPQSIDCELFGKVVGRVSTAVPPVDVDGSPTLGGMGVLDSDDEHEYTYESKGEGRIKFLGQFQTDGSNWQDDDVSITYRGNLVEAFIEPVANEGESGFFMPDKNDLVTVFMGADFVQTYQVVGVTGSLAIPPYQRRYVLNPRQDDVRGI